MNDFLPVMKRSPLFGSLKDAEIQSVLQCLSATRRTFVKGEYVLHQGQQVDTFGLVLSGSVLVMQEDFWGNRNIIAVIGEGEVFAESYACTAGAPLGVSVSAQENATVMFLDISRVLNVCSASCSFHSALIRNLVAMLAQKNLRMNEKLQHITQRTTREKLLSFLSAESARRRSASFDIPLNRQQLADYLSVDRSAMSGELCKLRDEGVLAFQKNHFELFAV